MPKNKRDKVVHLSKVKKKTREWKEGLVTTVRNHVDAFPAVYVLRHKNMRNDKLKELREELKPDSLFCFGSTKILKVALGKTEAEEYQQGLAELAQLLRGPRCLLFTKLPKEQVLQKFEGWEVLDYARAGSLATQDFELKAGPLENDVGPLPHTIEPRLRGHKLPVKLNRGVVELLADHTVCKAGQRLDSDQAAILRVFDVRMAPFRFTPVAWWRKEDGAVEVLDDAESEDEAGEDGDAEAEEMGGVDVPGLPAGL